MAANPESHLETIAEIFTLWADAGLPGPGRDVAKRMMRAYAALTAAYPDDLLNRAGVKVASEHRFNSWPTAAVLIAAAESLAAVARPKLDPNEVFETVRLARSTFGADRQQEAIRWVLIRCPAADDAAVLTAIASLGGWANLGRIPDPDPRRGGNEIGYAAARKAFVGAYQNAAGLSRG